MRSRPRATGDAATERRVIGDVAALAADRVKITPADSALLAEAAYEVAPTEQAARSSTARLLQAQE